MANSSEEENDTSFEVDEILQHRGRGQKMEYLVRWRGFGEEEDSWEPLKSLELSANEAIHRYRDAMPTVRASRRSRGHETERTVQVTKTVMTTRKATQGDFSSPESSPTVSRRNLRPRKNATESTRTENEGTVKAEAKALLDEDAVSKIGCIRSVLTTPCRMFSCVKLTTKNLPIAVMVACIVVISSSFYLN